MVATATGAEERSENQEGDRVGQIGEGWQQPTDSREESCVGQTGESFETSGSAELVECEEASHATAEDAGNGVSPERVGAAAEVTPPTTFESTIETQGGPRPLTYTGVAQQTGTADGNRQDINDSTPGGPEEEGGTDEVERGVQPQAVNSLEACQTGVGEPATEGVEKETRIVEPEAPVLLLDPSSRESPSICAEITLADGASPAPAQVTEAHHPQRPLDQNTVGTNPSAATGVFSLDEEHVYSERPTSPAERRKSTATEGIEQRDGREVAPKTAVAEKQSQSEKRAIERKAHNRSDITVDEFSTGVETLASAQNYLYWNRLLCSRLIPPRSRGVIHLAVSSRTLAGIVSDDEGRHVSPHQAEEQFTAAVREAYALAIECSARLRAFRCYSSDGIPLCVGILVLSVLAAHKMHADETSASGAYYVRLAELLGVNIDLNALPAGFRREEFESLWLFLAKWIENRGQGTLVLPDAEAQKAYIAYPLAHVPLRQLDLEKLPAFFDWAGYPAGSTVTAERIRDDLKRWADVYGALSHAGTEALNDDRGAAVIFQVRSELRAWNGSVSETEAKEARFVHVEVLLEKIGRRLHLSLLAPRREVYPVTFRCGEIELFGSEMWYEPLPIGTVPGDPLLNGFTWQHDSDPSKALRRLGDRAIVLAPHPDSDYSGYVSRIQLPRNVRCAVLCHDSLAKKAEAYLAEICDPAPSVVNDPTLPQNWVLFWGVKVVRQVDRLPDDLRALEVASDIEIIPQGGLRLGSQWVWMEGVPPRIIIENAEEGIAFVDGVSVESDEEGYLKADGMLATPGVHTVSAAGIEKKIRIEAPELRYLRFEDAGGVAPVSRHPVILEPGTWTLIGSTPKQVDRHENLAQHSTLAFCSFHPTWAIRVGAGGGAHAIQLGADGPAADLPVAHTASAQRWVSVLYEAGIRHPILVAAPADGEADPAVRWLEYVKVAKKIKRQWKRRR